MSTKEKTITKPINLRDPFWYINREIGQIEFNRRVLQESQNMTHPLIERLKFVAIFASNMDEFFMIRVSGLKQQVRLSIVETPPDGLTPREQLVAIHKKVTELLHTEMSLWKELKSALHKEKIRIKEFDSLSKKQRNRLNDYFETEIFPTLTPLALDPTHPFPHISNLSLNLAVVMRDPDDNLIRYARVKVPALLPRLVPLNRVAPDDLLLPSSFDFVWMEELIAANLGRLFPGMEIIHAHPFRITRNNDMEIQEDEADDLLFTIEESLRRRFFGSVVRLEVSEAMPENILGILIRNLGIDTYDVYTIDGPLALSSLFELTSVERPDLKYPPLRPKRPEPFKTGESIFEVLKRQDVLLHRPYDSFSDVIDMIEVAAEDPQVIAIKTTLYRVGNNAPIVHALMKARENNKQVAVLVELKARFDEESNIIWARQLEDAGVHVVYGLLGLKTHAKMIMIVRRERTGLKRYLHLSTGNYNASTARLYTDIDFFTSDSQMGADATELFNYLTGYSKQETYREFLVAPMTAREGIMAGIQRETQLGDTGRIIFKANSLVDEEIIRELYRASQAGVKIDLIIRGICSLRPNVEGVSENIRVISIIGRFLEHSRIYYFGNDGDPEIYIGSADLMPRNLDRRVEVLFPINDSSLKEEIRNNVLAIQLRDGRQSYTMQTDGSYLRTSLVGEADNADFSSQDWYLNGRITNQRAFNIVDNN